MSDIGVLIIPIGFVFAGIVGYFAVKKHWKIADIL
jgi:uncharacterized protein YneF (UPF0154 family)